MQYSAPVDDFRRRQSHERAVERVSAILETHLNAYGYDRIETPLVQNAELFLTKAGDQIMTRLFTFERGGQELALRPEFTASAAQLYVSHYPNGGAVTRWQFHGHVFEDDSASLEHFERYTIGAELIGETGPVFDAEIIAMAAHGLRKLGIHDATVTMGNVQLLRSLLAHYHLDARIQRFVLSHMSALHNPTQGTGYIMGLVDELLLRAQSEPENLYTDTETANQTVKDTQYILDVLLDATQHGVTMGSRTRHDIVRRLLQKRQRAAERPQIAAAVDFLAHYSAIEGDAEGVFAELETLIDADDSRSRQILRNWRAVIELLSVYSLSSNQIRLRPALTRNWDYYTGLLFDLYAKNTIRLGGGGRYDELARLIGGNTDIPSVGFVYYADTLASILPAPPAPLCMKLGAEPLAAFPVAVEWAERLRAGGAFIELITDGLGELTVTPNGTLRYQSSLYSADQADVVLQLLTGNRS